MKKILICFILISLIFCSCEPNPEDHFLISMSEFKRVELGDDYHEVVSIIGSEGNMLEEAGIKGTKLYSATYFWEGKGETGANAVITFLNDKVISKSQELLEGVDCAPSIKTLEVKKLSYNDNFSMHYIMSVKDEISEQIEMTDLDLALSDVRSTYNWTLWENEKEKVTMIFESEGDLIEGKLYSVIINLESDDISDTALKVFSYCSTYALGAYISEFEQDNHLFDPLLDGFTKVVTGEESGQLGPMDFYFTSTSEYPMQFRMQHFEIEKP